MRSALRAGDYAGAAKHDYLIEFIEYLVGEKFEFFARTLAGDPALEPEPNDDRSDSMELDSESAEEETTNG